MKVLVTGLVIKFSDGSKDVELDIEDARVLYKQLHDLFGEKSLHMPTVPIVIEKFPTWPMWREPMPYPTITCQGADILGS